MKKVLLVVLMALSASAVAGNCTYPDDIAADGSICGGRAASVRPGGYEPPPEYPAPVQSENDRMMAAIEAANAEQGIQDVFCFPAQGKNFTKIPNSSAVHFQTQDKGEIHTAAQIDNVRHSYQWVVNQETNKGKTFFYASDTKAEAEHKPFEVLAFHRLPSRIITIHENVDNAGNPVKFDFYTCPLN